MARAYFDLDHHKTGLARRVCANSAAHAGEPMPVPGIVGFVTCNDPQWNEFCLWQAEPTAQVPTG